MAAPVRVDAAVDVLAACLRWAWPLGAPVLLELLALAGMAALRRGPTRDLAVAGARRALLV